MNGIALLFMLGTTRFRINKVLDSLLVLFALVAVVTIVLEYGFYLSPERAVLIYQIDVIILWYFVLQALIRLFINRGHWSYLKSHWFDYMLVLIILFETVLFIKNPTFRFWEFFSGGEKIVQLTKIYIIAFQISLILSLLPQAVRLNNKIAALKFRPAQVLMISFLIIILTGTGLLLLPKSVNQGNGLSFVDALFTATSATCVTGLIVVDTGHYFSRMGQLIILILIQIGALGLMTYASFFALILRRNMSLREKSMMRDMLNFENMGVISKLMTYTIAVTFIFEIFGATLIFMGDHTFSSVGERIYSSVFHSISAFCNAGFSLYSDSFMRFQNNYLVVLTIATLIIIGGLGFPVLMNLSRLSTKFLGRQVRWLNVQSRLVLGISGFLLAFGTLFFLISEHNNILSGFEPFPRLLNAFFQSVTTRTAGFNTLDIGLLSTPTIIIFLILMFIGASPGSTGGGVKTTTLGVLFSGVLSVVRRQNRIELFNRNVTFTVFNRAIVIFFFSVSFILLIVTLLTFSENLPFIDLIFETVSAFGTVGLSRGITALLSTTGKLLIISTMYFGRIGALTISLAVATPREKSHYDYPSENVMVG